MITPGWVRLMAAYNSEMNRRLYAAGDRLADEQRHAERGAFFGSLHATLSHLVWADHMWMSRFYGWERPRGGIQDSATLHPEWEGLRAARFDTDARLETWAARVDPAWLGGRLTWVSSSGGREFTRDTALVVTHMFNHQTHHRGQAHALITGFGEETGATDLPFVLDFASPAPG